MTITKDELDMLINALHEMSLDPDWLDEAEVLHQKLKCLQSSDSDNYVIYGQKK